MSNNGATHPPENRLEELPADEPATPAFPPKPRGKYVVKIPTASLRVIAWEALKDFHGDKNGNVKERDRESALRTRAAVLYKCRVDQVTASIDFEWGWMVFESGQHVDHLLKCFDWQLSDKGPGIPLEKLVIADPLIKDLKVLSAQAEAELAAASTPDKPAKKRARSR